MTTTAQDEPLAVMIENLCRCAFGQRSNAKRFVRQMAFRLERGDDLDAMLTGPQKTYLRGLRHNYRKQIAALPNVEVTGCVWSWDDSERRWLTGCGYAFRERRPDHADCTGEYAPWPFCPYCGDRIPKPTAYGGFKVGELVEVDDSGTQGTVVDFVPGTPEVVVDHGVYTRCYPHLRLNYVD